jgi:hypothetical protein
MFLAHLSSASLCAKKQVLRLQEEPLWHSSVLYLGAAGGGSSKQQQQQQQLVRFMESLDQLLLCGISNCSYLEDTNVLLAYHIWFGAMSKHQQGEAVKLSSAAAASLLLLPQLLLLLLLLTAVDAATPQMHCVHTCTLQEAQAAQNYISICSSVCITQIK